MSTTPITWPSHAELERLYKLLGDASDELERLARELAPVYEGEHQPSFEELGQLTAFISALQSELIGIRHVVEDLARARDAVSLTSR